MKNVYSKIKNVDVKNKIIEAKKVVYNSTKHLTLSDLGYTSIYQICDLSKKRWEAYFKNNGKIYINKKSDKSFVPSYKLFLFDLNSKIYLSKGSPKPIKSKRVKRVYVKGDLNRKAGGLNIYLQKNDKFTKNDRKKFLTLAENYISIYNSHLVPKNQCSHTDPDLTDLENLDIWNKFFLTYGAAIPELYESWLKHNGVSNKTELASEEDKIINQDKEKLNILNQLKSKKIKYTDLGF
jgi:hypothetical protein